MAIQEMAWVLEYSEATGVDRLVLIVLANHYNRETAQCNPGYRRIGREARIATSTVGRSVERLVALGELAVIEAGAGHRTTKYHFPWLEADPPEWRSSVPLRDTESSSVSRKPGLASREGGPSVPPERDRSLKQNHEPTRARARTRGDSPPLPENGEGNRYDRLPSVTELEARQRLDLRADPDQQATGVAAARAALGPRGSRPSSKPKTETPAETETGAAPGGSDRP